MGKPAEQRGAFPHPIATETLPRASYESVHQLAKARIMLKHVYPLIRECAASDVFVQAGSLALAFDEVERAKEMAEKLEKNSRHFSSHGPASEGAKKGISFLLQPPIERPDILYSIMENATTRGFGRREESTQIALALLPYPEYKTQAEEVLKDEYRPSIRAQAALINGDTKQAESLLSQTLSGPWKNYDEAAQIALLLHRTDQAAELTMKYLSAEKNIQEDRAVELGKALAPTHPTITLEIANKIDKITQGLTLRTRDTYQAVLLSSLGDSYTNEKISMLKELLGPVYFDKPELAIAPLAISLAPSNPNLAFKALRILSQQHALNEAAEIGTALTPHILEELQKAANPAAQQEIRQAIATLQSGTLVDTSLASSLGAILTKEEAMSIVHATEHTNGDVALSILNGYLQAHTIEDIRQEYQQFLKRHIFQAEPQGLTNETLGAFFQTLIAEDRDVACEDVRQLLRTSGSNNSHFYFSLLNTYLSVGGEQAAGFVIHALADPGPHMSTSEYAALCARLIHQGKLTPMLNRYMYDDANVSSIQALLQTNPKQFNQFIETLAQFPEYQEILPQPNSPDFFLFLEAIDAFNGAITANIFKEYRALHTREERRNFAEHTKQQLSHLYDNKEIDPADPTFGILADMILLAYKPNMTVDQIQQLIAVLQSYNEGQYMAAELAKRFTFPQDGYPLQLDKVQYQVKDGEKLHLGDMQKWRNYLQEGEINNSSLTIFRQALAGKEFTQGQLNQLLPLLLKPLGKFPEVENLYRSNNHITQDTAHLFLTQLQEFTEVFLQDRAREYKGFLQETLQRQQTDHIPADQIASYERNLNQLIQQIDAIEPNQLVTLFEPIQKSIQKELDKFQAVSATQNTGGTYKAIISKSTASFFAKGAVGICTAQDVGLYTNPNHFHINVIREEGKTKDFVANIQAYVMKVDGKDVLMLRGFNPTYWWMEGLNTEAFVDAMIDVGKQFVDANKDRGITGLYISDPLDSWHALSNRETIQSYLQSQFVRPENERQLEQRFQIATNVGGSPTTINKVYHVYTPL